MKTTAAGIDYSTGMANVNHETGIHYGVISQNECLQAWADSSEPYYGENESDDEMDDFAEPLSFYIDDKEYSAESDDQGDIFITRSPYYTRCRYCSPCAPGAGYIMQQDIRGIKTYCFGHDFFEDSKAPYKVYSVKTNRIVKAEEAGS